MLKSRLDEHIIEQVFLYLLANTPNPYWSIYTLCKRYKTPKKWIVKGRVTDKSESEPDTRLMVK